MDQPTVDEAQTSSPASAVKYTMDSRLSRFTVQAFAGGVLSALGHSPVFAIRDFSGDIVLDSDSIEGSSMHLKIRADSLAVTSDTSDKDRREIEKTMNAEVLESSRYPEIIFDSRRISASALGEGSYMASIQGDLTLHGVAQSVTIPARVLVIGDLLRASGSFSIKQTDYRIKLASVAGGVLKIKDELKFNFDMVARKEA